jgi:tetratricopeptide (TPR) repeat protein
MRGSALLALAALSLASACATTSTTAPPPTPVTAPELKIVAEPVGPDALEAYDAETLLLRGLDLLEGGAWSDAADYFERLVREFPADARVTLAHYNRGVAYIHLGRGDEAVAAFDAYLAGLPPPTTVEGQKDLLDGRFKRGQALAVAKRYEEVVALFDEMLGEELAPEDRIEALVDAGVGHYMLGLGPDGDRVHRPTAEYRFLEARRILRKESEKRRMDHMQFFIAQASFYLAELAHLDFTEYKLVWPTGAEIAEAEAKAKATSGSKAASTSTATAEGSGMLEKLLGQKLEEKCQRLLRAQYQYLRAIRENHPGWASAAGYNVGRMYEELHEEMTSLPAPDDLTDEQKELYTQMVRKKVLILLEKAEKTWSQTAEMVVRTGADGEWGERTKKSLELVRRRLVEENTALATLEAEAPTLPMADSGKGKGGAS